jgi:hypothetical protein
MIARRATRRTVDVSRAELGLANDHRALIRAAFDALLAAFALYTIVYDTALVLSWSLATTMMVWGFLLAIGGAYGSWLIARLRATTCAVRGRADDFSRFYMLGLGIVSALVCLLVSKPNDDDSFYMSRAVLDWDRLWHPIIIDYPFAFVSGAGGIFTSLPSFEHFLAGIAGCTGTHPLVFYYFVAPAFIGFLLPFAWYLCLLRFGLRAHGAFIGTALIVILMLLDGTTIRGIANFSLFRIWQGKVVLVSVVTPLAFEAALAAVTGYGAGRWLRLLMMGVVGIGLSTTAAFFLPVLVGAAGIACWLIMPSMATIWRAPAAALAIFLYPAICVLPLYRTVSGPNMIFAAPFAFNLTDTLHLVYGPRGGPTLVAALAGAAGLLVTRRFRLLIWAAVCTAIIALPLAWPPTANLIVRYGTTPDALWRLAYATPVILTVGLGLGAFSEAPPIRRVSGALVVACAALTVAVALLHVPFSPFTAANVSFPTLAYKLDSARLAAARVLVRDLPKGTILAPESLSVTLPLISSKLQLTNFRDFDATLELTIEGHPDQAKTLELSYEYVSGFGDTSDQLAAFQRVLGWGLDYVVLDPAMPDNREAIVALTRAGYRELMAGRTQYRVFQRPGS